MKRSCLTLLGGTVLIAVGLGLFLWFQAPDTITIVVTNRTSASIPTVIVQHDTHRYSVAGLAPAASATVVLTARGETTYSVEAHLTSGLVLRNNDVYAEPGYRLREVVSDTAVTTEVLSFYQ